jgi:hypothetical protein
LAAGCSLPAERAPQKLGGCFGGRPFAARPMLGHIRLVDLTIGAALAAFLAVAFGLL